MSTDNKSSGDDFQLNIDSAIDNMFNPSRKIEIDPQTGEVKETAPGEGPASPISLETDPPSSQGEIPSPSPPESNDQNEEILEKLDQSFMALDWEISAPNIAAFRDQLNALNSLLKIDPSSPPGQVVVFINKILQIMAATPDQLPTTTVKTIQKGLVILREMADGDPDSLDAVANLAKKTINDLKKILESASPTQATEPQVDMGNISATLNMGTATHNGNHVEELSLPEEMLLEIPDDPIPLAFSNTINLHLTILSQCINRILPLEKLFAQNPRYDKLLARHRELRELFEEEKDIITSSLITDHGSAHKIEGTNIPSALFQSIEDHINVLQRATMQLHSLEKAFAEKKGYEKLGNIEKSIQFQLEKQISTLQNALQGKDSEAAVKHSSAVSTELNGLLSEHIQIISECVKNIIPMENLFGKTKGYEKLHALQKKIRTQLSNQVNCLTKALSDTPPCSTSPQSTSKEIPQKPPWQTLRVAHWAGVKVAFIPEQIGLETHSTAWATKLKDIGHCSFTLKNLRKWPWSKIRPLFVNELGKEEEKHLLGLDLPILNAPGPIRRESTGAGRDTLLILFQNSKGAAAALDSPTIEFAIHSEYSWQPLQLAGNKYLLGYLVTKNESIPVLSL